ncbi:MAG TPA: hypothetical protein VGL39_27555 [Jatrophihabitantaceae bacterium]|jgi:hypothetical protein
MTDTTHRHTRQRLCSLPGCGEPATRQWQRAATDRETAAYVDGIAARVADQHALAAVNLQVRLAELEHRQIILPPTAEGEHVARLLADNIAETQRQLAELGDAGPVSVEHHLPCTVAVFGCDAHAPDLDHAAELHAERCLTADPCGCPR